MKNAQAAATPASLEQDFIRHRLSWFATLQGLLFLSFVLVDKSKSALLPSVLVCIGVAMCLPAIGSAYSSFGIKNKVRVALAVCWVTAGTVQFILRAF